MQLPRATHLICHCASQREAEGLKALLNDRFNHCGLTLHPAKTKIAYCKGGWNKARYDTASFDFVGYTFRPRWVKTKRGQQGLYFIAAVSQKSAKRIRQEINSWPWKYWRQKELTDTQILPKSAEGLDDLLRSVWQKYHPKRTVLLRQTPESLG